MSIKPNKSQDQPSVKKKKDTLSSQEAVADNFISRFVRYVNSSRSELTKVSWPTWKEVKVTGYAVAALVVVMALLLGVADFISQWMVDTFLSMGN